jgi:hypothetical protein
MRLFVLSMLAACVPAAPPVDAALSQLALCPSGAVVPCDTLAASWASGDATCTAGRYDVSTCALDTTRTWGNELVKPAERDPRWDDARTNNGDPWPMEVSLHPDGGREWVIRLGGGGFCDDDIVSCLDRGWLARGSGQADGADVLPSKYAGIKRRWVGGPGMFGVPNDVDNPDFHDAHFVTFTYKSSDLWTGASLDAYDTSCVTEECVIPGSVCDAPTLPNGQACTGQWYRRGRIAVRAGLEMLIQRYGLDDADAKVLFMGTSAGAWGAQHTADIAASLLPATAARGDLRVAVDGAWSASWSDRDFRVGDAYSTNQRNDFVAIGIPLLRHGGMLNRACIDGELGAGRSPYRCIASSTNHFWLTRPISRGGLGLPVFVQKSQLDSIELGIHLDASHLSLAEDTTGALADWVDQQAHAVRNVDWRYSCPRVGHTTLGADNWWSPNASGTWPGLADYVGDFWHWDGASPVPPAPPCLAPQCTVDADCAAGVCLNEMCIDRQCVVDADCDDGVATTLDLCRDRRCAAL